MSKTVNPDLAKERHNNFDLKSLTRYLGETRYPKPGEYNEHIRIRDDIVKKIQPVYQENFYNLNRDQKYQMVLKKSLEVCEYSRENNYDLIEILKAAVHPIFGAEKFIFGLHVSAFMVPIDLWGTDEQRAYWKREINEKPIFGTYVQTEVGHGTYIRGLETTATYDRTTQEFILDSPTLTSTKFWPGTLGKTCNHGLVMAQLIIDGKDHGLHGFVCPLRSLKDHKVLANIEVGDIGNKFGFDTQDNGYMRFNKYRIPRFNMLMRHAVVTSDGEFKRVGNELIMYACMLILRAILIQISTVSCSVTTTIAIRYSCVRRQTAVLPNGEEPQIIEYKTQQYRLFPALAHSYAYYFTSCVFLNNLAEIKEKTNGFETMDPMFLNKIHSVTACLKATSFINALKFSQANRLCCGGHGYSLASGIPQQIVDLDAGSSYEGDNIVLLLQTARFLLKCAQKNISPHLAIENAAEIESSSMYKPYKEYFDVYHRLYDESLNEITSKMMILITEKKLSPFEAWNESSVLLINASKVYANIYVINCFLSAIYKHNSTVNQTAMLDLFELFILYDITDVFSTNVLRFHVIDSDKMAEYNDRLSELLNKIRVNAVLLTDAFDWSDNVLCSALGAYDGQAYERLLEFAKNSEFNKTEVHEGWEKYQKPYADRLAKSTPSKL